MKPTSPGESDDRRAVLAELRQLLWTLGTANDAQDRDCAEEAERLRRDACKDITELAAKHTFLADLFPKLQWEVDSGNILGTGWLRLSNALDAQVKHLDAGHTEG
jgi:hypothetical protein